MYIYNFYEQIDTLVTKLLEDARKALLTKTLAEAKGAHPMTIRALEAEIQYCTERMGKLLCLKATTPIRLAIAANTNGGDC